jgi:hypothetical protein
MNERTDRSAPHTAIDVVLASPETPHPSWQRPRFSVIPLDCEISAYAPDGEEPLF